MATSFTYTARHEIDCSPADYTAVGYMPGYGPIPERILVQLDSQPAEVCALAAWDTDYWMIAGAQDLDGNDVELTPRDEDQIRDALDRRREIDAEDF